MSFQPLHIVRTHSLVVALPPAQAFFYFTPEGERDWAPGWDPLYRHPTDGALQRGMVFTTGDGDDATIWTVIRHEPPASVEYVRTTPASRTGTVLVQLAAEGADRTRVTVTYSLTALNEEGNRLLAEMDEEKFRGFIAEWETAIAAAISRRA